jgi:glycosyltransferase involved in cell wall biosynthesis
VKPPTAPFFSVIITTYNRAALLKRALNSLLAQTETDWEAIIIDDGSTDQTEFEVCAYRSRQIKYFRQESHGASEAKNRGMYLSRGKFITFLDSDDEYHPTHLESRKQILINNQIDFLHGGVEVIGNQFVPDRYNYGRQIPLSECAIGGTFFIRKNVALLLKGFRDLPLGSDGDLLERADQKNISIAKTNLPTYIYHRENGNSITNNLAGCESFEIRSN